LKNEVRRLTFASRAVGNMVLKFNISSPLSMSIPMKIIAPITRMVFCRRCGVRAAIGLDLIADGIEAPIFFSFYALYRLVIHLRIIKRSLILILIARITQIYYFYSALQLKHAAALKKISLIVGLRSLKTAKLQKMLYLHATGGIVYTHNNIKHTANPPRLPILPSASPATAPPSRPLRLLSAPLKSF
jgi:hypothetical protein